MGVLQGSFIKPVLNRDIEGHRNYKVTFKVRAIGDEGPYSILNTTPGLPLPGTPWAFGSDVDVNAWCLPEATVEPVVEDENVWYHVTMTYTTKPPERNVRRCQDTQVESPLLEPPKVKIGYRGTKKQATHDRFGVQVKNSGHQQIRGAAVEFDEFVTTITIEQNLAVYNVRFHSAFQNRVNDSPIYGMPARTVLVKSVEAEERYYGLCYKYYARKIELEINEKGFDRDILDESSMVLKGKWDKDTRVWTVGTVNGEPANPSNPLHFDRMLDAKGNPTKIILDGFGVPFSPQLTDKCDFCIPTVPVEYNVFGFYDQAQDQLPDTQQGDPLRVIKLTHSGIVGQCVWTGTYDFNGEFNKPMELTRASGLFSISCPDGAWEVDESEWDCINGGNRLERTLVNEKPRYLYVTDANQPGMIHVEFHSEANLTLLGIPLFIGS